MKANKITRYGLVFGCILVAFLFGAFLGNRGLFEPRGAAPGIEGGSEVKQYLDYLKTATVTEVVPVRLNLRTDESQRVFRSHLLKSLRESQTAFLRPYLARFQEMGIDSENQRLLAEQLLMVRLASWEAEGYLTEFKTARVRFDQSLRGLVSSSEYGAFLDWYYLRRVDGELARMIAFAEKKSLASPSDSDRARIREVLIEKSPQWSPEWDGPIGAVPDPVVGSLEKAWRRQKEKKRLESILPDLKRELIAGGGSSDAVELVSAYFEDSFAPKP